MPRRAGLVSGGGSSGGSGDATSIDGVPVDAPTPTQGDVLIYDGSDWVNAPASDLAQVLFPELSVGSALHCWRLNEPSGTTFYDAGSSAADMTFAGGDFDLAQTCMFKGAACVRGTATGPSAPVASATIAAIATGTSLTMSIVMRAEGYNRANTYTLLALYKANGVYTEAMYIQMTLANLVVACIGSGASSTYSVPWGAVDSTAPLRAPLVIDLVWDAGGAKFYLYLNGEAVNPLGTAVAARTDTFTWAEIQSGTAVYMGEARIYPSTLSAATIRANFNTLMRA